MNKATALRELRKKIKTISFEKAYLLYKDYLNFAEIDLVTDPAKRYDIIKHYAIKNEKVLMKFVNGLTNEMIDFDRYEEYKLFRDRNKFDSNSEEFFKLKYGNYWEEYFVNAKKNKFNMYSAKDYIEKRGMSVNEAEHQVAIIKNKTTASLTKYIIQYGAEVGEEKFKKVCRVHKNYIDYWNSIYPNDVALATQKFTEYKRKASLKCLEFYEERGISVDEATSLISKHQLANAGVHRQYYERAGLSENEIDSIMKIINDKKDSASLDFISNKYPDKTPEELLQIYSSHNLTKSSSIRDNGYLRKDDPDLSAREAYYAAVDYYTVRYKKLMLACPGVPGTRRGNYHVDHKYSRKRGYEDNIPANIIGHVSNLEWILAEVNCSKRADCSISKEELLKEYTNYENQINKETQS